MPCHKKHKMFLPYLRFSAKEGLFSETSIRDQDIRFGRYDKDIYRKCEWCCQVFALKKHLKKMHLCAMAAIKYYKTKILER